MGTLQVVFCRRLRCLTATLEIMDHVQSIASTPIVDSARILEQEAYVKASLDKWGAPDFSSAFGIGTFPSILGPEDRRTVVTDTGVGPPWATICALLIRGKGDHHIIGTGWLAGPNTVVTAGHCIYSTDMLDGWAEFIHVIPGRNGLYEPYGSSLSTDFEVMSRWHEIQDPALDVGCIHLKEALGQKAGWLGMADLRADELTDCQVTVSGYPSDRGGGKIQYAHTDRITRVTESRVYYRVDTFGGQSGSPIWINDPDTGKPLVVGVHAYGVGPDEGEPNANWGPVLTPAIREKIDEWSKRKSINIAKDSV